MMRTRRDIASIHGEPVVLSETFVPPPIELQSHPMFVSYTPVENITWVRIKSSARG